MQLELRELQETVGITFIFVTHDQEEALTLSDRVAVMARGDVLQMASPQVLYHNPVSVEVAGFIGQINFFDARVVDIQGDKAVLDTDGLGQVNIPASEDFVQKNARIVVALRPEKLKLAHQPDANSPYNVKGELSTSTFLGDRSHFYVLVEGHDEQIEVAGQDSGISGPSMQRGSAVWLSWNEESIVVLPAP
jgi:spermidine/putrescine transport system ATP-binding protein/putrescine transport system ATP-binding protein